MWPPIYGVFVSHSCLYNIVHRVHCCRGGEMYAKQFFWWHSTGYTLYPPRVYWVWIPHLSLSVESEGIHLQVFSPSYTSLHTSTFGLCLLSTTLLSDNLAIWAELWQLPKKISMTPQLSWHTKVYNKRLRVQSEGNQGGVLSPSPSSMGGGVQKQEIN